MGWLPLKANPEVMNQRIDKPVYERQRADPKNVVSIILGGGAGAQLFPLTSKTATPADARNKQVENVLILSADQLYRMDYMDLVQTLEALTPPSSSTAMASYREINDLGESVWKFESLDPESLARLNKKDSWLFWWSLYLTAAAWIVLGIFSLIRFQADYLLVVAVCLSLSIANIVGFTKCNKDAKKQFQQFAAQTFASQVTSTIQSAFSVV